MRRRSYLGVEQILEILTDNSVLTRSAGAVSRRSAGDEDAIDTLRLAPTSFLNERQRYKRKEKQLAVLPVLG